MKQTAAKPASQRQATAPVPQPAAAVKPAATVTQSPAPPKTDPEQGARALAKLWDEMAPSTIVPLLDSWKDEDAARVLGDMDQDKAAAVLSALAPKRASAISELIEKQASLVKSEQ